MDLNIKVLNKKKEVKIKVAEMIMLRLDMTNYTETNNPFRVEWGAVCRAVSL